MFPVLSDSSRSWDAPEWQNKSSLRIPGIVNALTLKDTRLRRYFNRQTVCSRRSALVSRIGAVLRRGRSNRCTPRLLTYRSMARARQVRTQKWTLGALTDIHSFPS